MYKYIWGSFSFPFSSASLSSEILIFYIMKFVFPYLISQNFCSSRQHFCLRRQHFCSRRQHFCSRRQHFSSRRQHFCSRRFNIFPCATNIFARSAKMYERAKMLATQGKTAKKLFSHLKIKQSYFVKVCYCRPKV